MMVISTCNKMMSDVENIIIDNAFLKIPFIVNTTKKGVKQHQK